MRHGGLRYENPFLCRLLAMENNKNMKGALCGESERESSLIGAHSVNPDPLSVAAAGALLIGRRTAAVERRKKKKPLLFAQHMKPQRKWGKKKKKKKKGARERL